MRPRFNPWVRKIPWRRKWPSTPVFLPREFQYTCLENSMDRGAWDRKELDTTKWLHFHFTFSSVFIHTERNAHVHVHTHTSFLQEPHLSWGFILTDRTCEFWNRVGRMKSASQRTSFTLSQSCLSNYLYTSAFSVDGNLEGSTENSV